MNYYQAVTILNIPSHDRYAIHCHLDRYIRKKLTDNPVLLDIPDFVPRYTYFVAPDTSLEKSIVMIRSPQSLGVPGEQKKSIQFKVGDKVDMALFLSLFSKNIQGKKNAHALYRQKATALITNRLAYAGFEPETSVEDLMSAPVEDVYIYKKSAKKHIRPFCVPGVFLSGTLRVIDAECATRRFVDGISRKKGFGFGLMCLKNRG